MYNYDSDIISLEELCEWLMIGRTTASRLLNSGAIKCFKINRIWKIPRSSVIDYIKKKSRHDALRATKIFRAIWMI